MNKKIKMSVLLLIMILTVFISINTNNAKADNTPVITGDTGKFNGFDHMPFKKVNGQAAFCTLFHLRTPTSCSLTESDWTDPVKAGVGAIITKAKAKVNDDNMTEDYYYAELAINEFLYDFNGKNLDNQISKKRSMPDVLGDHKEYYEEAIKAFEKAKSSNSIRLQRTDGKWYNENPNNDTITNTYKINSKTFDYYTISTKLGTGISSNNVSVSVTQEDGSAIPNQGLKGGGTFKVTMSGLDTLGDDEKVTVGITVTGYKSFDYATNYSCGTGVQTLTLNTTSHVDKTNDVTTHMVVKKVPQSQGMGGSFTNNNTNLEIKKESTDGSNLSGALFQITKGSNESKTTDYTDNNGLIKLSDLESGYYCIQELLAPDGYVKDDKKYCFNFDPDAADRVTIESQDKSTNNEPGLEYVSPTENETEKVVLHSKNQKNKIEIEKVDENGNQLSGVSLSLRDKTYSNVASWNTNDDNPKEIEGLPSGIYYIVEESAPDGYAKISNEIVYIDEETKIRKITLGNHKTVLNISKVDITTKQELKGAKLRILDSNCQEVIRLNNEPLEWTSGDTAHTIIGLKAESYCLEETQAPNGYGITESKIKFTIKDNGLIKVNNEIQEDTTIVMNNKPYEVLISKKSLTTGEELAGAHLQILDNTGKVIEEWDSTTEPHPISTKNLKPGTYKLKETIAPAGYVLSEEEIIFKINKDGSITVNNEKSKDSMVIMTNEYNKVYISKQDVTTKQELPGAHLVVKDENGNIVKDGEWDSTNEPHLLEGLEPGTYTITEVTAPEGYIRNEETVTFTVDKNGAVSGNTVMYNTPSPQVPSTLSTQSIIILIVGIILIGAGSGLYLYEIKKKKEN